MSEDDEHPRRRSRAGDAVPHAEGLHLRMRAASAYAGMTWPKLAAAMSDRLGDRRLSGDTLRGTGLGPGYGYLPTPELLEACAHVTAVPVAWLQWGWSTETGDGAPAHPSLEDMRRTLEVQSEEMLARAADAQRSVEQGVRALQRSLQRTLQLGGGDSDAERGDPGA